MNLSFVQFRTDVFDSDGANGGGGLSVTGCLSDFSMHVFHPYGGARKIRRDESVSFSPPNYYDSDRKDSLSVNVAFVKFHLSRTRRLTVVHVSKDNSKLPKQSSDPNGKASIRFSTIVDIGKATFSYDMRRLTEILAFPKAWYRRTLVRRLFLGELKTTNIYTDVGGHSQRPSQTYRDKGVYNQTNEIIFALPCLRMDLKTDHIQGERPPSVDDTSMPHVDCSFVTDFEDHIFVTVDAEAFFFLHDLISSYIKEKEKFVSSQASTGSSVHSPHTHGDLLTPDSAADTTRHSPNMSEAKSPGSSESDKSGEADKKPSLPISSDWRIFECKTWHLEPTVRLQSWAGKKIEPYGVDYILQKLGFSHAKTTIPKWMQVC